MLLLGAPPSPSQELARSSTEHSHVKDSLKYPSEFALIGCMHTKVQQKILF